MSSKNFIKENFVLLVGLTLPVLLMAVFMLAVMLPNSMSDPPKYDMVFWVDEYRNSNLPVNVNLSVDKDGVLTAQYTKNPDHNYYSWKKLYIYEAKDRKVRELPLPLPEDANTMVEIKTEPVAATSQMKLDTTLQSPDGFELSYDGYWRGGFMSEVFWGGGYSNEVRLRKGSASFRLMGSDDRTYFYYGNVRFLGWVKQ